MSMRILWLGPAFLVLALTGCGSYVRPQVDMVGQTSEIMALSGSWHGTFRNTQLHREGEIDFRLSATADSAYGEVVMYTESPAVPIWTQPPADSGASGQLPPTWQQIRFVRVDGGYVSGEMQPMYEPRCKCFVVSRFIGRVSGSTIEGSFTARSDDGLFETSGSWRVRRVTDPSQ